MAGKQRAPLGKRQPANRRGAAGRAPSAVPQVTRGSTSADFMVGSTPVAQGFAGAPAALPSLLMRQAAIPQLGGLIGNRAVASLVTGLWVQPLAGDAPRTPADVIAQSAFNPMDIADKLMIAIDQKQFSMHSHGPPGYTRHVDFAVVAALLNNKTRSEILAVNGAYFKYLQDQEDAGRPLREDLLGGGESGMPTDLTPDERAQIEALLGGTKAEVGAAPAEQSEAATNAAVAQATELHTLLQGKLKKDEVEKVMALLRRGAVENGAMTQQYQELYKVPLSDDLSNLDMNEIVQASMLLIGSSLAADSFKVALLRRQIEAIDVGIAKLTAPLDTSGVLEGLISVGSAVGGGLSDPYGMKLKELRDNRGELVTEIERLGEQAAAEASSDAKANRIGGAEADAAVKARVGAVFGNTENLAKTISGGSSPEGSRDANIIRGIGRDDPVLKVAAQLRKLEATGDLDAKKLTAAMHGLRQEADARAHRALPVDLL